MEVRTSNKANSLLASVRQFFYAEEVPYGLAIIRVILPLILLCVIVPRWSHSRELYSTDGAPSPLAVNYGFHDFTPEPSGTVAVVMATALVFCLVTSSLGWHTRTSLVVACGLYTYLCMLDSLSSMTKYSVIASHVLFLLSFSNCGCLWSIDSYRRKARSSHGTAATAPEDDLRGRAWPRRLIQLLIGLIYFGAAFTKMHTDGFLSADQIRYWLLTNLNNENPIGEYLALYPAVIVTMSHIAIVWQVLFPFISWRSWGRAGILSMGVLFHLLTVWLLGLYIFPFIMITTYFSWMNAGDARALFPRLQKIGSSLAPISAGVTGFVQAAAAAIRGRLAAWSVPSAVMFGLLLTATIAGGVELEYRADLYGHRREGGPHQLEPLSADEAQLMLKSDMMMRESDKYFSLEIGRDVFGSSVVKRGTSFRRGDRVIAQVTLTPPHEDLLMDCRLEDTAGRQIHSFQQPVTRDMLRANFHYQFPMDIPEGTYCFVIHSNGEDVISKTIRIE